MAVFTFIENNNLDGKTIIPFSTHKGSGLGSSISDLKTALPNSTIKDGLACNSSTTTAQIKNWIENSKKCALFSVPSVCQVHPAVLHNAQSAFAVLLYIPAAVQSLHFVFQAVLSAARYTHLSV